ncbi:MAG: CDP-alcohol phosphatidyltransferase family protein [Firmicutes bacterium]|nr:CDP-alcohol phosphatidyltransferase family protein [Bacillota bacterium]
MADIITGFRIVCSIALLFFPVFSPLFYTLYIAAGVSDMIDGTVARKTGTVSEFGSVFDTAADLIFVAVCLIKLIPVLNIESWMYIFIVIIAMIKIINVVSGFVVQKKPVTVHSAMNKITGGLLFILPLTIGIIDFRYSAAAVCAAAAFAAVREGHFIRTGSSEIQNGN